MSSNGWTNDHTWGVAGAVDNTADFDSQRRAIIDVARNVGPHTAANYLRDVIAGGRLTATLPSWVDLAEVDWLKLTTSWADDE